jgi:dienelactone hydrolase
MVRRRLAPALLALLTLLLLGGAALAPPAFGLEAGWRRIALPASGSFLWRYVPASLEAGRPAPAVVFFHGAGARPTDYTGPVAAAAEAAGLVALLPRSEGLGWGRPGDEAALREGLQRVVEELPLDPRRIGLAGHSAGGAWAYLLAYGRPAVYSGVFALAAPFYPLEGLARPGPPVPIRMGYGAADRNYTGGAAAALGRQWDRLGVPWSLEVYAGHGHDTWPQDALEGGFQFLAGRTAPGAGRCVPAATALCLGGERFRVEVAWEDFSGGAGPGRASPAGTGDSGLFWFFDPDNWEILVKVLDGCGVNGHHWVFAAATTNVRYVLTVTDTATGEAKSWENRAGVPAPTLTDTAAFTGCPVPAGPG